MATGAAICFVPQSMIATVRSDQLTFLPVTDLPPVQTALVWSSGRPRPVGTAALAAAANRLLAATDL